MSGQMLAVTVAVIALLSFLAIVRILLSTLIAHKAGADLRDYCVRESMAGRLNGIPEIAALWDRLESESLGALVLRPSVWTARQAHPWLYDLIAREIA